MARKSKNQMEFRPDPTGSGLLSKLYITPIQRGKLLKWGLYSLVTVAVLVIQDVILSQVRLFGGHIDLTPAVIMLVCVMEDGDNGGVFALAASVIYLFSGSAPGPYAILLVTAFGILGAVFRQSFLHRTGRSFLLCAAAGTLLYQIGLYLIALLLTQTYAGRIGAFLMTGVLSSLALPAVYPALEAIRKIGGEAWKE